MEGGWLFLKPKVKPLSKHISVELNSWIYLVGWLVELRMYVALAVFQPYHDLKAGDNQSLNFKLRGGESNPRLLAPQAKSLTNRPPPLPWIYFENRLIVLIELMLKLNIVSTFKPDVVYIIVKT